MIELLKKRETIVWFVLASLTLLSWILADGYVATEQAAFKVVSSGLIVLAFFKIRLIVMYFMEIRTAPMALRLMFEAWIFGVAAMVIGLYLWN